MEKIFCDISLRVQNIGLDGRFGRPITFLKEPPLGLVAQDCGVLSAPVGFFPALLLCLHAPGVWGKAAVSQLAQNVSALKMAGGMNGQLRGISS